MLQKLSGILPRAYSALIFVVVMLVGMFGGVYSFISLFGLIAALCLWEFYGIVLEHQHTWRCRVRRWLGIGLGLMPTLWVVVLKLNLIQSPEAFVVLTAIFFWPFIFTLFIFELFSKSPQPFANLGFVILGLVYIGAPFALVDVVAFDGEHFRARMVFGLVLLTWVNDTGAYVVGSLLGKTPLLPRISPKKTMEGTLGGMMVTMAVALLLSALMDDLRAQDWLIVGALVAVFGTVGDLVESMLKRSYAVKDSGGLLPGHGGLLDRFDAFMFHIPFTAAYLLWIR